MRALKEADGDWHESDHAEANYAIVNSVSEGDGYTMAEMWAVMGPWRQKWEAIKAADGQWASHYSHIDLLKVTNTLCPFKSLICL